MQAPLTTRELLAGVIILLGLLIVLLRYGFHNGQPTPPPAPPAPIPTTVHSP